MRATYEIVYQRQPGSSIGPYSWHVCGLLRLSGLLALRDTAKARARAALISIGRPATKEEVAQQCGLDPTRAAAQLSAMDDVVRARHEAVGPIGVD